MRTTFPQENDNGTVTDTDSAHQTLESEEENVKWPKRVKHRNKVLATIYRKSKSYPFYRLAYYTAGKRHLQSFTTYSEAKTKADKLVKDLAKGSQAAALSARQASDAIAAMQRLETFRQATGRRVSLLAAVSEFCESAGCLPPGRTMGEAIEGFKRTIAAVKRMDVSKAAEEFIAAEDLRTKAPEGKRSQLSAKYAYNRAIMLRRFAATFPNTSLSDLGKEHLDAFITSLSKASSKSRNRRLATSAKSRNHHRAAIRQFLQWAVRKDYLSSTHRLGEADAMRPERANDGEIHFYMPDEFEALLEGANGSMRAMIAIGGLAGLRTSELLSLDWADVWRIENHIEVTAQKSKTRQRRLVEICPALSSWLDQFKVFKQGKVCEWNEITWQQHFVKLCLKVKVKIKGKEVAVARKPNGLRHSFCSYHFAVHSNENLTAMLAGNSPAMIHAHYKGLATKKEAEKWFGIEPKTAAENVVILRKPKTAA